MWAHWLPNATIVGVDIGLPQISPPANLTLVKADATSPASLNKLSRKFDRPHVVLDDASHFWSDQRKTLELFWPWLVPGGTYIIEDLHTSFEEGYSGDDLFSTFNLVTKLASGLQTREEELARFQARENPRLVGMCEQIRSITFIRRAVIMRKNSEGRPGDLG
jgi:23S rRNA U2552 (ribose-2'-O)-methylase RlmE/FtsJ